jgi:hypothetical protein
MSTEHVGVAVSRRHYPQRVIEELTNGYTGSLYCPSKNRFGLGPLQRSTQPEVDAVTRNPPRNPFVQCQIVGNESDLTILMEYSIQTN